LGDPNVSNYYPSQPVISLEQWQNIIDYYTATSPDSLPIGKREVPDQNGSHLFSVETPKFSYASPAVSFSGIHTGDSLHPLVLSDVVKKITYLCSRDLSVKDSFMSSGPIVDMDLSAKQIISCDIGILNPNNGKFGKGRFIVTDAQGRLREDSIAIFDSLRRPVQIVSADLNNDSKTDYIICEFGNLMGSLSWMENTGNNTYKRHVLRDLPGAIRVIVNDYNHDGAADLWALFAQGDEGVFLFTNRGGGNFDVTQVLRFPPVYGSSYFEMADFNKDGFNDILYTCGDNADFSPVLKPYHGVYIFINDGKNHFQQRFFYPVNGCYKAMARDFDNDGDLDLATIAYFPDFRHHPDEGFIYLEQQGPFQFKPYAWPECRTGRWLTMDAGDVNGDGKPDILLGNFSIKPSAIASAVEWKKGPVFLVLKNQSK
jgi:hypothetical protein